GTPRAGVERVGAQAQKAFTRVLFPAGLGVVEVRAVRDVVLAGHASDDASSTKCCQQNVERLRRMIVPLTEAAVGTCGGKGGTPRAGVERVGAQAQKAFTRVLFPAGLGVVEVRAVRDVVLAGHASDDASSTKCCQQNVERLRRMIVPLTEAAVGTCGGKAGTLGGLLRAGLPVPDGFVVPFDAYRAATHDLGIGRFTGEPDELDAVRRTIESRPLPAAVIDALGRALAELGDPPVAVRSSAADED